MIPRLPEARLQRIRFMVSELLRRQSAGNRRAKLTKTMQNHSATMNAPVTEEETRTKTNNRIVMLGFMIVVVIFVSGGPSFEKNLGSVTGAQSRRLPAPTRLRYRRRAPRMIYFWILCRRFAGGLPAHSDKNSYPMCCCRRFAGGLPAACRRAGL